MHIVDGQVQSLGARGGHNVRRVSCQKQASVLHRLDNEASHGGDAFFQNGAGFKRPAVIGGHAYAEFFPDAIIRPIVNIFVGFYLNVQAADFRRSEAVQGESPMLRLPNEYTRRWMRRGDRGTGCEVRVAGYGLQVAGYELRVTSYGFRISGSEKQVSAGLKLRVEGANHEAKN